MQSAEEVTEDVPAERGHCSQPCSATPWLGTLLQVQHPKGCSALLLQQNKASTCHRLGQAQHPQTPAVNSAPQ